MATLKTLNELFNNSIYRIPDYQRGYAWTPNQLKDFWDDLNNLNEEKNHYTGVLTVKSVPSEISNTEKWNEEQWLIKERGYKAYYVVDGQQRLTTCIIFIQAIIEVITKQLANTNLIDSDIYLGSFSIKYIKDTFISIAKPPHDIIKTYKFGYETDNPSFKFLRHRILNEAESGKIDETFYTLNLENAKRFFVQKLSGILEFEDTKAIFTLYKKLTVNFKFNLYEIEDDFDVFVAFETMNNRGKKLSNLELLKNRLIYLTTLYDARELKEDDRISLRHKIDEAWKEIYYQLGRNKTHPLNDDDFLIAHWIIYFQYTRQKGNEYVNFLLNEKFTPKNIFEKTDIPITDLEEFEEIIDNDEDIESDYNENEPQPIYFSKLKPKQIEDYINSLKASAVHWYNTFNPIKNDDLTHDEQIWIDRLNRIGIAYFRPLVTSSFLNDNISPIQRVELFKAIERFIFLVFRMKGALSNYRNSEFFKASRNLRTGDWNIEEVVKLLNDRMDFLFYKNDEASNIQFFDYGYFQKYINKHFQNGGGYYWWNSLKYFLYEYEMTLVYQRGSQKIDWNLFIKHDNDKVSIEHILPQTPSNSCWKAILKGFNKPQIARLQTTLGNMVPLSCSINSSIQNDCFEDKKKAKYDDKGNKIRYGYNDGSHSEIEISNSRSWGPDDIKNRGLRLLEFIESRWDIKFESYTDKLVFLGLPFLEEVSAEKLLD